MKSRRNFIQKSAAIGLGSGLISSIPNFLIAETILTGGDFHQKLINNSIVWEEGYIISPELPGLGITFNEELAIKNPYNDKNLHLEMKEDQIKY